MATFGLCPRYRPLPPEGDVMMIADGLGRSVAAVCDEDSPEGRRAMRERAKLICELLNDRARQRGHQFRDTAARPA